MSSSSPPSSLAALARKISSRLFPLNVHQPHQEHSRPMREEEDADDLLATSALENCNNQLQPEPMTRARREDIYFIKVRDKFCLELSLPSDARGIDCIRKVCDKLNILEIDYFGLQHKHKGCLYWVNLRNPLRPQITACPDGLNRLHFRVKFFVPPHLIQQDITRQYFYYDIFRSLRVGLIELEPSVATWLTLIGLIAQIEFGNYRHDCYDLVELYRRCLRIFRKASRIDKLGELEQLEYSELALMPKIIRVHQSHYGSQAHKAIYAFLEEATNLENIGVEYYPAILKDAHTGVRKHIRLGIGAKELVIKNVDSSGPSVAAHDFSISYTSIIRLKTSAYNFKIRHLISNGEEEAWIKFRFSNYHLTTAAYRLATEKKIFYSHDHVIESVSEQHIANFTDLLYTLTKSFLPGENATLDKRRCFVFDIERTLQQFRDDIQRQMWRARIDTPESSWHARDEENHRGHRRIASNVTEVAPSSYQSTSVLCKICRDSIIDVAFVPCGHMCCHQCASRIDHCCECRTTIETKLRVYLS